MKSNRLQTTLRLPKNLDEQLSKISMEMGVSKNSLIVFLLTESLSKFSSQKMQVKESEQESVDPVDSCSQTTLQDRQYDIILQPTETHNCLDNIVVKDVVNNVVVNNVCSYTTTNREEQTENRKAVIVELTRKYREATGESKEDDYRYIGRLCKEYDAHLIAKAIEELEYVLLERKVDNPRGYLRGILKKMCLSDSTTPSSHNTGSHSNRDFAMDTEKCFEKWLESKINEWNEDFLRRVKNDKYAQFYEWG
ncbi:hypothetical protein Calhy_0369 [Caldicellulosiruptor hydrothermalis 108]|uniref:Uncharacterized protein n=1 Tax=Caldicellulosiruptor hydrothermalis (strain DSM 18901 / VKM B-2411 / 108) TaxID=632292 RepID=E4QBL5_CALH1|nr:hypothetical protein [Caldicellulosiruptor hydrothermalis]ADQ06117.1 hypothetical protein Calhy_0369 [Caldicellulosiruptor hydrothermalis 108]